MKRILSAVVCLAMVLTMLPAVALLSAQAAEEATYTYVTPTPASIIPADNSTKGAWYINGSTFVTTPGSANYIEIVADGYADTGALHVYQDNVANNDMSLGMFLGGQPAGTYTVKMYVKGDLGHMGQICRFYPYGCIDQAPNLHNALGTTDVADWTEVSYQINATSDFYYFIFTFSKYNWKSDFYVDNLQLINSSGVNVLGNGGNFYSMEEVTTTGEESGMWPDSTLLDLTQFASAYRAFSGVWTPMYRSGQPEADTTWPAWDGEHYAEFSSDGYKDPGSIHMVSAPKMNTALAINAGMIPGQTYTLGLWAKGTVNTGKVMGMYDNGGGVIIGNTASFLPGWNYYEHTFTANLSQLNIVAADWGWVDIYVDNITLTDVSGKDLLAGCGDFYTTDSLPSSTVVTLDTTKLDDVYDAPEEWVPFSPYAEYKLTWPTWEAGVNYGEIVEAGYQDAGALHLVSAAGKNTGVVINPGMVSGQQYTIGMWVKGTATSNKMLAIYNHGDPCLIGNPNYCGDVCLSTVPAEWTYIEKTFTAKANSLPIFAVDWGTTDIYIDNITLKDTSGKDLLAGYGDFCEKEVEEPEEPTVPEYQPPTEEGWIGRDEYTQLQLGVDYDYSFAVLGDIQHITDYTPSDLHYLFDYILDNKDAKNIQFVFGMGDTTNDNHNEANNLKEWKLAQEQFFRLNDVLPYTVVRGNHDVVARMNAYFADPAKPGYTDQLDGFYQAGSVVNVWKEFSVAGVDYLSLLIDYESSDSVLAWASDVIASHPNHRVIVSTHIYLQPDGSYDMEMNPTGSDPGILNNAQQVWDKLISQHENIFLVLSGHESTDDVAIQHKTGIHGNTVTEMRIDSQYTDLVYMNKDGDVRGGAENGVGMVTMLYFKEDGTQVAVEHYSTLRDWYRLLQTFEIAPYDHYGWRYDGTQPDLYKPDTGLVDAPDIWQNGLGSYSYANLVTENDLSYAGAGVAIVPDYNMNPGSHTYALHSGSRAVEPSQTYTISYKIKGLSADGRTWTQIHFCRSALGGSDTWESQFAENQIIYGPVSDWQTVSYDVTMDDKTSAIEIYFIVNGSQMLIDDFSIVKKGQTENIVTNGDFELGNDGQFPTGFYAMKTGGVGSVEKVSGAGVNGTAAVRVEPRPGYILKTDHSVAVEGNATYTLSYMVRVPGKYTSIQPVIRLYNKNGGFTELTGEIIDQMTPWQRVSYTLTTNADTVGVQPCLLAYGGRVDVDNLSLKNAQGQQLLENGNFAQSLDGFTGEFVQGISQGTIQYVHSARPNSLIMTAKAENGVLNIYEADTLVGTAHWFYGQLEHKVNLGLYVADAETAQLLAAWIDAYQLKDVWVISSNPELLDAVSGVRLVLDCRADNSVAEQSHVPYVLISDESRIPQLKQLGYVVILASDTVTEAQLSGGADAILTGDSLAAIGTLEAATGLPIAPASDMVQWNLTLGGNIGVNFHIQAEDPENTRIAITVDGTTTWIKAADAPKTGVYYVVSANVAAAQMTQPIQLQIYENGQLLHSRSYTVRQYADHILAGNYGEDTKTLVKEMLNYGAAAQQYFGCCTHALASDGIAMGDTGTVQIPVSTAGKPQVSGVIAGVSCYGASLIYQSNTAVRIYFTGDVTACAFAINGIPVTAGEKNGISYVELADISPDQLADTIAVTVTKDGQTFTVTYSPIDYIVRMYHKGDDALKPLLQALYNYYLAAVNYR